MSDRRTPIERLIDSSNMKCSVCNAPWGACSCWERCPCGWYFRTGEACRGPSHAVASSSSTPHEGETGQEKS